MHSTTAPSRWKRAARILGLAALVMVVLSVAMVMALRFVNPPTSAFILEKAPAVRGAIRRTWVPIDDISSDLKFAVLASEDQKFPDHAGFDVDAIEEAIDGSAGGKSLRGASSISQQTAKNLFLWSGRSFLRKGLEAYFTVLMEAMLPKRRILELYLNFAEFGAGIFGVEAASQAYFKKPASAVTLPEAALLASVLPNPVKLSVTLPSARVVRRAAWITEQVERMRRRELDLLRDL